MPSDAIDTSRTRLCGEALPGPWSVNKACNSQRRQPALSAIPGSPSTPARVPGRRVPVPFNSPAAARPPASTPVALEHLVHQKRP